MLILSSISKSLEYFSKNNISAHGNNTSANETSKSKVFKNIKFLGEISNNWLNYSLGTNVYRTIESC